MKAVTVFVPEEYLEAMERLVETHHFPNRSEAIRSAIRDMIKAEYRLTQVLEETK